ncbi:similar to Saccharomyces cerevisiae YKL059C MPE1 Essential conserved subunit of CPF (cleavage and polyadenylation factor) [Maudiozyma saulgeensis]|uniref:Similar to Saccharomyces cerevisiae YKL059C MPE1 Essential conserved subunit of CPF (Cleavage and polyadenylation factor) n=1 Tax=Maudiozyma saulgeensis TaxID=1789683 RepID=A0A1X7QWG7_9SACH|nr:similar to Saccharomyces cerevisiae YKL059C MPE1 Essential conserved subunit of CPF (cleavage and polyadenylation factor) [Kazachstania saulgeensis]
MSSTIFYRWKSQREPSRILFDGTGLTVFDLKREIIQENKLGDGIDFQLRLYNPDTDEEYDEDQTVIARSSSVIARRSPAISKISMGNGSSSNRTPHKMIGNAARYVTGRPRVFNTMSKRPGPGMATSMNNTGGGGAPNGISEEDRIANMFANQENQWEQTQQEMSTATPIFFKNNSSATNNADDGPPPPGYMCYRCGSRDHWIKNCPTNTDPNFEGKRIRRTTGIPKKFLKSIEIDPESITPEEMAQRKIMVTDEGKFVVQVADEHSWEDYQRKQQLRTMDSKEAIWGKNYFKDLPEDLKCPITGGLIKDPVKTSKCCNKIVSRVAMEDSLLENDFTCALCNTDDILLDSLIKDEETQEKVNEFIEKSKTQDNNNNNDVTNNDTHIDKKLKPMPPPPMMPFPMFPPFMPPGGPLPK